MSVVVFSVLLGGVGILLMLVYIQSGALSYGEKFLDNGIDFVLFSILPWFDVDDGAWIEPTCL